MTAIAQHAPLVYTPAFFTPEKAYRNFIPDVEGAYDEGVKYAKKHGLPTAQSLIDDGKAHALWITDLQGDFRDNGRLPVKGTDSVVLRTTVRLLNGVCLSYYGGVIESRDGHPGQHISYGTYWRDQHDNVLDLRNHGNAACLTLVDEKKAVFKAYGFNANGIYDIGYYQPRFDAVPPPKAKAGEKQRPDRSAVTYWNHLKDTGQGDIWVFNVHCKLGSDGANTHPLLLEALAFAEGALCLQETIVSKGHISTTDWFGAFEPCWPDDGHPQGGLQKPILEGFKPFQTVETAGVAEDFCKYHGQRQAMTYLKGTPFFEKLRFITDCTAAIIPNAPHVAAQNEEARLGGIKFITHDAPLAA